MTEQTQTVVDTTKTAAQPAVAGTSAPDDVDQLDKLLAEFDQSTKPDTATQPESKTATQPAIDPAVAERMARIEQRLLQEDINGAVKSIVGDLKVPHRIALGWLDQMARENPAIERAFRNKTTDPKTWARLEKSLNKELAKELSSSTTVDENATADHAAVAASMKGASTKVAPEPAPDFGRMSDAELREFTRKNFGF